MDFTEPSVSAPEDAAPWPRFKTIIERQRQAYEQSVASAGASAPILDAIETTLGWDTIYEPDKRRVISPVSRVWNLNWGGYVLFDWDTFFAATLAGIGDRDLAYANAMEILREETPKGFVPNYARARRLEELRSLRAAGGRDHGAGALSKVSRPLVSCTIRSSRC